MNIVLIPIAGLMLIILVFILKSIPQKERKQEKIIKALIILSFLIVFVAICYLMPPTQM